MKDRCQVFRNRPNAARLSTKRIRALAYLTHAHTHALAYTLMHTHSHTLAQVYTRTLTHILKADFEKKTFLRPTASGKGRGGHMGKKRLFFQSCERRMGPRDTSSKVRAETKLKQVALAHRRRIFVTQSGNHILCTRQRLFRSKNSQLLKQIQSRAVSQPPVGAKIGENQNRKKEKKESVSGNILETSVTVMCSPSPKRRRQVDVKSPISVAPIPKASQCNEPTSTSTSPSSSSCWQSLASRSRSAARRLVRKYRHRRNCQVRHFI